MSESQQEVSLTPPPDVEVPPAAEVPPAPEVAEGMPPADPIEHSEFAEDQPQLPEPAEEPALIEPPLFHQYLLPEPPRPSRTPHLGHVALLALLATIGFVGSGLLTRSALHFHLWGISTVKAAITDVHYTIASMASLYLITFLGAALIFPLVWRKSLSAGVQWNAQAALLRLTPLLGAAGLCFVLAMVDEVLIPGPSDAPIDKMFDSSAAAWLLFAFGVTFAPFFEEIIFRGFLLPAFATAFDWSVEKSRREPPPPLDSLGHPQWSLAAMVFGSVITSVPFALMHAEQTGWALGPFLLLVVVSLILCWARLSTRSLAASVIVHASYNFLLFSLMLLGTHGFKHMDKI